MSRYMVTYDAVRLGCVPAANEDEALDWGARRLGYADLAGLEAAEGPWHPRHPLSVMRVANPAEVVRHRMRG